jgi:peptidoglycan/LPS O-acetylase OafA/YrhL
MWTYRPQLDGLRTVAVYLVLLYHAGLHPVGGGFIGVDVFFVLSGFLVSNVILSEIDVKGRLSLGGFYARRVRRLLPAAVVVVVATSVVYVIIAGLVQRLEILSDSRAALLYFANWHFLASSNDYFQQGQQPSPFLHFWSLSVEEQFYVFFPVLLALLHGSGRRWARNMAITVAVLMSLSLASQVWWQFHDLNHAYYGTDARLYQLLAGALLAIVLRHRPKPVSDRQAAWVLLAGAVGLAVFGSGLLDISPSPRGIAAMVCSVALIGAMMQLPDAWLSRLLSRPTPVYLGKISYGTYLWHWPVIMVLKEVFTVGPWTIAVLSFGLSTGLAALSFQVLESPIRRTPKLAPFHWPVVAGGLTLSVLAALLIVPPVLQSHRTPALASADVAPVSQISAGKLGREKVPTGIDWRAKLHDNGHAANCPADDVAGCMVVKDNGPLVLLVGDSFANMMSPMFTKLAHEHHFALAENVVQGCPWPENLDDTTQTQALRADCQKGRDGWYESALKQLKPQLVVLVMKPRDDGPWWGRTMKPRTGPALPLDQLTLSTMDDTVAHLEKLSPQVLLIQGVMGTGKLRPLDCLAEARTVGQCAVPYPLTAPPSDGYMQALAAGSSRVSTMNINRIVCPTAPVCLPYRKGQIVWRDQHHLMTGFALANRGRFWKLMGNAGALKGLDQ